MADVPRGVHDAQKRLTDAAVERALAAEREIAALKSQREAGAKVAEAMADDYDALWADAQALADALEPLIMEGLRLPLGTASKARLKEYETAEKVARAALTQWKARA